MPSSAPSDALSTLPPVLVGPILRRLETDRLVLWLVGSESLSLRRDGHPDGEPLRAWKLGGEACR